MAFKMKGFSGFKDEYNPYPSKTGRKIKEKRAKRLVKKFLPEYGVGGKYDKSDKKARKIDRKLMKADYLLKKAGYDMEKREHVTGAGGLKPAMDWAEGYGADPIKDIKIDKRRARKKYNKELKEAKENRKEERKLNSPQKVSKQLVKKGLKTGAKVVGKRILKTALGPVGLAWDAYDIAKAANKWRKKRRK